MVLCALHFSILKSQVGHLHGEEYSLDKFEDGDFVPRIDEALFIVVGC